MLNVVIVFATDYTDYHGFFYFILLPRITQIIADFLFSFGLFDNSAVFERASSEVEQEG